MERASIRPLRGENVENFNSAYGLVLTETALRMWLTMPDLSDI